MGACPRAQRGTERRPPSPRVNQPSLPSDRDEAPEQAAPELPQGTLASLPFSDGTNPAHTAAISPHALATSGYTGLERQRGAGRRLSEFGRSAEEGELNREQFLFLMAIEEFKRGNTTPYPAWSDVLEVVRLLGYRKTMPSEIALRNAEDWKEKPDAPSNVRPQGWERRFRLAAPDATSPGQHNEGTGKTSPGRGPKKRAA